MSVCIVLNGFSPQWRENAAGVFSLTEGLELAHCVQLLPVGREPLPVPAQETTILTASHYEAEPFLSALTQLYAGDEVWVFDRSLACAELAPRLAVRRNGTCAVSASALIRNGGWRIKRACWSAYLEGEYQVLRTPLFVTAAPGLSQPFAEGAPGNLRWVRLETQPPERLEAAETNAPLSRSKRLIALGRGARSAENCEEALRLAEDMGFDLGISRAAATNGWLSLDRLLGVSGAIAHPEICIACGVSGAPALYAGLEKSRHILAINRDPHAPICQRADAVIQGDSLEVLRLLCRLRREGVSHDPAELAEE